jgi:hypothetical protein
MGAADSRSLQSESYASMKEFVRRSTFVPFQQLVGDMRREFMQRFLVAIHGTMGSYLRYALQEGGATHVACLLPPRA